MKLFTYFDIALAQTYEEQKEKIKNHNDEVKAHREAITSFEEEIKTHHEKINTHNHEITILTKAIKNHNGEISNHRTSIKNHRAAIKNHEKAVQNLSTEISNHNSAIKKESAEYDYTFKPDIRTYVNSEFSDYLSSFNSNYDFLSRRFKKLISIMELPPASFVDAANNYTFEVHYNNLEFRPLHADLIKNLTQVNKKNSYQNYLVNNKIKQLSWNQLFQFFNNFFSDLKFFHANDNEGLHEISSKLLNIIKSDLLKHLNDFSVTEKFIDSSSIVPPLKVFLRDFMCIDQRSKIIHLTEPFASEDFFFHSESYNKFSDPNFYIFSSQLFRFHFYEQKQSIPQDDKDTQSLASGVKTLYSFFDTKNMESDPNLSEDEDIFKKQDLDFKIAQLTNFDLSRFENFSGFSRPKKSDHQIKNSRVDLLESILRNSTFFDLIKISNQVQPKVKSINSYIASILNYNFTAQLLQDAFFSDRINENDYHQITHMLKSSFLSSIEDFAKAKIIKYDGYSATFDDFNLLSASDRTILIQSYEKFTSFESWIKTVKNFITLKKDCLHFFINLYYNSLFNVHSPILANEENTLCFDLLGPVKKFITISGDYDTVYSTDIIDLYDREFFLLNKLSSFNNRIRDKVIFVAFDINGYLKSVDQNTYGFKKPDSDFLNELDYSTIKYQSPFSNLDYFCAHFNVANFRPSFPDLFSNSPNFFSKAKLLTFQ